MDPQTDSNLDDLVREAEERGYDRGITDAVSALREEVKEIIAALHSSAERNNL